MGSFGGSGGGGGAGWTLGFFAGVDFFVCFGVFEGASAAVDGGAAVAASDRGDMIRSDGLLTLILPGFGSGLPKVTSVEDQLS